MSASEHSAREILIGAFRAAVEAVSAERLLPPWLSAHPPPPIRGRTLVVGAGKAAGAMAASLEAHWPEDAAPEGLVITRQGHGRPTRHLRVLEAGHPLPDTRGLDAARQLLDLLRSARPEDRVLALISGGGSSLLSLPAPGLTLTDLATVSRALLRSGAPIADINCVRKHLSQTLGGRLAEACGAPVEVLMISDVTGDDISVIASGPFAPDPTDSAAALAVLSRWHVDAPPAVVRHLTDAVAGMVADTPKPGAACFTRVSHHLLGNGRTALQGAAAYLVARDIRPVILGDTVSGEAREVAQVFAALAREIRQHGTPWKAPVALLSGGETSVTVRGNGRGGRNMEFQLALALALSGLAGVHALAADTDGIDGTTDAAGCWISPDTLIRAAHRSVSALDCLTDNDAYRFFGVLDDLIHTGPTGTNANDFRALLIS